MYGEPLQPNRCKFQIGVFDGEISIFITDLDEEDNDDVREVVYPDFDNFWGNSMENCFVTEHFQTMQQATEWCVSIGMTFDGVSDDSDVKVDFLRVRSPYERYNTEELKKMLKKSIDNEEYEKSAEINAEIKKREA